MLFRKTLNKQYSIINNQVKKVEFAEILKIEYCMLSVECLITVKRWHFITNHYKQHRAGNKFQIIEQFREKYRILKNEVYRYEN